MIRRLLEAMRVGTACVLFAFASKAHPQTVWAIMSSLVDEVDAQVDEVAVAEQWREMMAHLGMDPN